MLGLEVVELMTLPAISVSKWVAQKTGFVLVGTLKDYKAPRALDPTARHDVKQWALQANRTVNTRTV